MTKKKQDKYIKIKLIENIRKWYLERIFKKSAMKIKKEFRKYINKPKRNWKIPNSLRS